MSLAAPVPLTDHHPTEDFACGVESLDHWLKRRALKNQLQGASRTYVVCNENQVVAYYALALGACRTWESSAANRPQRSIFHRLLDP